MTIWRVPDRGELNELFNNRATIGSFDESEPTGWYWSSTEGFGTAWGQRFSDGEQDRGNKELAASLRLVRG